MCLARLFFHFYQLSVISKYTIWINSKSYVYYLLIWNLDTKSVNILKTKEIFTAVGPRHKKIALFSCCALVLCIKLAVSFQYDLFTAKLSSLQVICKCWNDSLFLKILHFYSRHARVFQINSEEGAYSVIIQIVIFFFSYLTLSLYYC
jgi:hypothetical protein